MSDLRRQGRGSRRRLKADINVVPYLDVLLVLLVIFMVTAPIVTPGVIDVPSVGPRSSSPAPQGTLILAIDGQGRFKITDQAGADKRPRPMERAELEQFVARMNPDQPVAIQASGELNYAEVVRAMDLFRNAGVKRVGLMVEPSNRR